MSRTASTGSHDSAAVQSPDTKDNHTRSRDVYHSLSHGHVASSQYAQYSYEPRYNHRHMADYATVASCM